MKIEYVLKGLFIITIFTSIILANMEIYVYACICTLASFISVIGIRLEQTVNNQKEILDILKKIIKLYKK